MIRTVTNLVWKVVVVSSALYGTIQLGHYVKNTYQNHVTAASSTPGVDTLDDVAKKVGGGIKEAGDVVANSVDYIRPYVEGTLEDAVENGKEKSQE